ncbi:N-acetylglucosamine-6-phosphate deacetylase-like [Orbicella faveolata]|uniref:N-acetylglucosamine-6-phosphate deacetylase-like n=1 Tax=Orbicella faveolata TaxID=48498 RepID=UPI0009E1C4C2|nr:N-acetylglucosamine-6-phosphate deacetylase-like [Orbicella faveolata]XP_020630696.1 N-acetylglucosamine-6-phosphate deacetylase-like [Orbicella faveolata]XP_020630697.1 N-acetylglucosamine-6-phosphate deacetylase-like [Orbicella faveolata]
MTSDEFKRILEKMHHLKIMTISPHPEASNDYKRIKCLLKRGVVPALGHDKQATEDEILAALSLGETQQFHLTHLFNVCSFHHRSPGLVNFRVLDELPNLPKYRGIKTPTVEIIGDLAHVDPLTISLLLKSRHFKNIAFITDFLEQLSSMETDKCKCLPVVAPCQLLEQTPWLVVAALCLIHFICC